jgi:hypothetical protein
MTATKAQIEALRWLIAGGRTSGIRSSGLAGLYEDRYRAKHKSEGHDWDYIGQPRQSAWRRTSGRVLERMKRDGLMRWDGWDTYSPKYTITDEGFGAAK